MSGKAPNNGKSASDKKSNAASSSSGIRWIDLTEEQKRDVIRIRNAESARRSRQNKREKESKLESEWEDNERRIENLEKMVDDLTDRLRPQSGSSAMHKNASSGSNKNSGPEADKRSKKKHD